MTSLKPLLLATLAIVTVVAALARNPAASLPGDSVELTWLSPAAVTVFATDTKVVGASEGVVPEPGPVVLLGLGLLCLAAALHRKRV